MRTISSIISVSIWRRPAVSTRRVSKPSSLAFARPAAIASGWHRTEAEDLDTDLPAKGLQLFNSRRPVDIRPHHQSPPPLVLEMQSEFGGGRGLTCTLQTGHQHHRGGLRGLGERCVIATHHLHELLVDHLNELLVRADAPHNLSANGLLPDVGDEILHHRKADIGLKKGTTHVLQRPLHIGFADLVLAFQPLDRIFKRADSSSNMEEVLRFQ